jgi:hypothetical protein
VLTAKSPYARIAVSKFSAHCRQQRSKQAFASSFATSHYEKLFISFLSAETSSAYVMSALKYVKFGRNQAHGKKQKPLRSP